MSNCLPILSSTHQIYQEIPFYIVQAIPFYTCTHSLLLHSLCFVNREEEDFEREKTF